CATHYSNYWYFDVW
nr:immunoglobulin heavy chain junction region [Mus musculus]